MSTTFNFINALRPEGKKSEQAKETCIIATSELKSRISLIEFEIQKTKQLADMDSTRASREAAKTFNKVLGNVSGFNIDNVVNAYKNVKNTSATIEASKAKLADLEAEKAILQEILGMYPVNPEEIVVEEEKA